MEGDSSLFLPCGCPCRQRKCCIAGKSPRLHNVKVVYNWGTEEEVERSYGSTSQANLVKALETKGIDGVRLLEDLTWSTPGDVVFQNDATYIADSATDTIKTQVQSLQDSHGACRDSLLLSMHLSQLQDVGAKSR